MIYLYFKYLHLQVVASNFETALKFLFFLSGGRLWPWVVTNLPAIIIIVIGKLVIFIGIKTPALSLTMRLHANTNL